MNNPTASHRIRSQTAELLEIELDRTTRVVLLVVVLVILTLIVAVMLRDASFGEFGVQLVCGVLFAGILCHRSIKIALLGERWSFDKRGDRVMRDQTQLASMGAIVAVQVGVTNENDEAERFHVRLVLDGNQCIEVDRSGGRPEADALARDIARFVEVGVHFVR